jgi:microcystin-dependent protein
MLADGSAVSRLLYPELFALLGTTYGAGDGSTTFNLPDLRGRFLLGAGLGTGLTNRALAAIGGEENHQLTLAELAAHAHPITDKQHTHSAGGAGATAGGGGYSFGNTVIQWSVTYEYTGITGTNNAGGNGAHNNVPPFLVLTYIIKVSPTGGSTAQAPIADSTQDGLMRKVSGLETDFVDGTNTCRNLAAAALPTGAMIDFAGVTAPEGFLITDGSAQDRILFAGLFAVIGTTYGAGDGSTTFNLPDCRGRTVVAMGQGTGLTDRALAATGGEEKHVLTIAELAAHSHVINDGPHRHTVLLYQSNLAVSGGTQPHAGWGGGLQVDASPAYVSNQNTGSGTAHNTMPPFIALNKIIKT